MQLRYLILLLFIIVHVNLYSQENNNAPKIFYKNERTFSVNLLTNGWGIGYRYGNRINYFEKKIYELDVSLIKHPKEVKSSASWFNSESFVFGKLNYVFDIHAGLGRQNEIFSKRDPGSISVKYFYTIGASIALLKPIYYKIYYAYPDTSFVKEEKFSSGIHTASDISGKASFFKGFDEIKIVPGAYIKAGVNFEFSQNETRLHIIELGAIFQAYSKTLEIMAVDDNQQFLFSLFISYRFGKVINAQNISEEYLKKRKKKFKLF